MGKCTVKHYQRRRERSCEAQARPRWLRFQDFTRGVIEPHHLGVNTCHVHKMVHYGQVNSSLYSPHQYRQPHLQLWGGGWVKKGCKVKNLGEETEWICMKKVVMFRAVKEVTLFLELALGQGCEFCTCIKDLEFPKTCFTLEWASHHLTL